MREDEWLTTTALRPMLKFVRHRASDRKARLFACACWRRVAHSGMNPLVGRAINVAERFADGEATDEERVEAHREAVTEEQSWHRRGGRVERSAVAAASASTATGEYPAWWMWTFEDADNWYAITAATACAEVAFLSWRLYAEASSGLRDDNTLRELRDFIEAGKQYVEPGTPSGDFGDIDAGAIAVMDDEERRQCEYVREVFGNPFRPVAFDPAWRTEHTVGIAGKMYDDRDFAAMPILADALEEAGCDNADILAHCRNPGVHVRGCWVVDLVLGKE